MKLKTLGASALILAITTTAVSGVVAVPQSVASPMTVDENPWNPDMTDVAPITVRDPKAELMLSVADGQEPVFEIAIEDIGLYFGYLIPAHVAGFETTRRALDLLYPEGVPERGQIRVAGPEKNDIMLVASYLTGARDFYLVEDEAGGDLVIDPTLGADQPGKYVMIFQREDNGRTVEAVFDRPALVPDNRGAGDYGNTAPVYINLLNGRTPQGEPEEHNRIISGLMELILEFDPEKLYSARVVDGYDFPETGRLDPMPKRTEVNSDPWEAGTAAIEPAGLTGVVANWFAAAEAMNANTYAQLFAQNGTLTIGNGETITGRAAMQNKVGSFFDNIEGLDHEIASVWTSGSQTFVKGRAIYTLSENRTVDIPMSVSLRLNDRKELIQEAQIFIDPTPLTDSPK